jgi:polyhydroxyalkanoate synthesis regulator phasin
MERKFETALEARKIVDDLAKQVKKLNYNPQYKVFLNNLDKMINDLSSAEVVARQSKKSSIVEIPRERLALAIDYFEKLILIQTLSQ